LLSSLISTQKGRFSLEEKIAMFFQRSSTILLVEHRCSPKGRAPFSQLIINAVPKEQHHPLGGTLLFWWRTEPLFQS
jgi:hypothetical protein